MFSVKDEGQQAVANAFRAEVAHSPPASNASHWLL